jgi:hypothetical protein
MSGTGLDKELMMCMQGDSFNLLGCLLTGDQLATETLTAMYFMFADSLIISQVFWLLCIMFQTPISKRLLMILDLMHVP